MNIETLRDQLRQPGARLGVGVWLMPRQYLGHEEAIAARLNVQALDVRLAYLESLPAGARFSGLTHLEGYQNLTHLLRSLAHSVQRRDCLLVYTLDLLLLGLEVREREQFWRDVLEGLPYPRTKLILAVPEKSTELFPLDLQRLSASRAAKGALR